MSGQPGKSVMPIGLRGVGKTVLLNRFAEIAEQEGLGVGFIEAPETGDFRILFANRLRKILITHDSARKTAKAACNASAQDLLAATARGPACRSTSTRSTAKPTAETLPTT